MVQNVHAAFTLGGYLPRHAGLVISNPNFSRFQRKCWWGGGGGGWGGGGIFILSESNGDLRNIS